MMTMNADTARDDLAFMRALVSEDRNYERGFGLVYGAAGVLYGLQCLINGWMLMAAVSAPAAVWMALGTVPTVLFVFVIIYNFWQRRGQPAFGTGASKRALNGAFAGGGLANLVLAALFGWVAYAREDWTIWFLYPVVVAALQGAIWYAATVIRRRFWTGVTATGWFASTVVLGLLIDDTNAYIMALGVVLLLCMALPGHLIIRSSSENNSTAQA